MVIFIMMTTRNNTTRKVNHSSNHANTVSLLIIQNTLTVITNYINIISDHKFIWEFDYQLLMIVASIAR